MHNVDNLDKPIHGVFLGDGVELTNAAWNRAREMGMEPDSSVVLVVPMNEPVGVAGGQASNAGQNLDSIKIVVVPGTNKIITSYPTN